MAPAPVRARLLELRGVIFAAARETPEVGAIRETLKWGDPAYLPAAPRIGTTVRINAVKGSPDAFALYVHCQTTLLRTFRTHYPETFRYQGERAILFDVRDRLPLRALKHCIALAFTYHLKPRTQT